MVTVLKESKQKTLFKVVFIEHLFTDNLELDDTPVVRVNNYKNVLDPLLRNRIQSAQIRGINFIPGLTLLTFEDFETGFVNPLEPFKPNVTVRKPSAVMQNAQFAYDGGFLPKNPNPANDKNMLLNYVNLPQNVTFYESIQNNYNEIEDITMLSNISSNY